MKIRFIIILLALLAFLTALIGGFFYDQSNMESVVLIVLFCAIVCYIVIILYRQTSNDIIKLKRIEEELRNVNHGLQALFNAAPLPIIIVDTEGTCILWNPSAEQVFGWTSKEVLGRSLPIIPENRHEEHNEFHRKRFEGHAFRGFETQRVKKDGTLIDVALSTASIKGDNGEVTASMGIYEELTERKRTEEERLKGHLLSSIGILAGGIAHDFNNLLTVIVGNISYVKVTMPPSDKAYGRLDDAENVCEMAADLSKRLITFATGGDPIRKIASFPGLLKEAVNAVLKDATVRVEFDLPDGLSLVDIDEGQMKQVFTNLAINAREAMPEGGALEIQGENLHVSANDRFPMREGDFVKISIRDSGAGIAAERLSKIFDPYYSTKDTYSQKGLGLGLAVSYSIIKRHDGLITAESENGRGTTFSIYLPAAKRG